MPDEAKRVMDDFISAVSSHDAEKLATCFTEDCFYQDMALGGTMRGRKAVKAGYTEIFTAIPDFKLEVISLFIADNWIGSEWIMTGTSSTGKSFSTQGASISELREGKIKRNTDYYDPASFLQATR